MGCFNCGKKREDLAEGIRNRDAKKVITTVIESIQYMAGKKVITIKGLEGNENGSSGRKT